MKNRKMETVDIAKGICIILVVAGHYSPSGEPAYWALIRNIIYRFHMPLFFLLSGYLYGMKGGAGNDYWRTVRSKVSRLVLPFLSIAVLVFLVKYVSQFFFQLQNPFTFGNLLKMFYDPMRSYNPLLWFIYALFIIFLVHPLLTRLLRRQGFVLLVTFVVSFIPLPGMFTIDYVAYNLPLFSLGVLLGEKLDLDDISPARNLLTIIFSAVIFFLIYVNKTSLAELPLAGPAGRFILAASGCGFVVSLASILSNRPSMIRKILSAAGFYSMSIYLLHTIFESAVRIFFYQIIETESSYFVLTLVVALLVGTLVPVLIEKYVLRKYAITRRMILGLK